VGGATRQHPAVFVMSGTNGRPGVALISNSSPDPAHADRSTVMPGPSQAASSLPAPSSGAAPAAPAKAAAFPFKLPKPPGPGGTQALAVNTRDGGVTYDIAYALVTVTGGKPVTETNSAYAFAHCRGCTTVAVSFQVVLVVGQSKIIAPTNAAGSLNYDCPACLTTAIADQIVVTLKSLPPQALIAQLQADLKQLNALPALGASGSPSAIASTVAAVQHEIETQLGSSGLLSNPPSSTPTASSSPGGSTSPPSNGTSQPSSPAPATGTSQPSTSSAPTSAPSNSAPPQGSISTTTSTSSTTTTTTTTTSSGQSPTTTGTSTTTTPSG
jgi:putative peptide zinc metalloprotease protein